MVLLGPTGSVTAHWQVPICQELMRRKETLLCPPPQAKTPNAMCLPFLPPSYYGMLIVLGIDKVGTGVDICEANF